MSINFSSEYNNVEDNRLSEENFPNESSSGSNWNGRTVLPSAPLEENTPKIKNNWFSIRDLMVFNFEIDQGLELSESYDLYVVKSDKYDGFNVEIEFVPTQESAFFRKNTPLKVVKLGIYLLNDKETQKLECRTLKRSYYSEENPSENQPDLLVKETNIDLMPDINLKLDMSVDPEFFVDNDNENEMYIEFKLM